LIQQFCLGLSVRHVLSERIVIVPSLQPNHSSFMSIKHLYRISMGAPPVGALNTGGVKKFGKSYKRYNIAP